MSEEVILSEPMLQRHLARYLAFISYSHHDQAIAKRLQRGLERYRLPRYLVGRQTSVGAVPSRIGSVFRDRDELRAGPDLKASIEEALQQSSWLVVVCSPHAAQSTWVNREIEEFKRLHGVEGPRRVLALIASGEPFASHIAGREHEESFPPALRMVAARGPGSERESLALEPLAADMREHGDGIRPALLKLLATMLGVGFDELARRDLQRRMRWLAGMAAASVAGMTLLAWLAVSANRARGEAERQRAQAEGLVEFMLVDLRKQLDAVGRLDILDAVGTKILDRYADAGPDAEKDTKGLAHRARAQHLIGEIRQQRGKLAPALAAYQSAAKTTEALLAKQPGDPQRIFDHAQSVFWVGSVAHERHDHALAERYFLQYLGLAQRLLAIDPAKREWQIEWAYAKEDLAVLWLKNDRFAEALPALREAGEVFRRWTPTQPVLAFELAQVLGWTSRAYKGLGDHARAIAIQREKRLLLEGAPNAPDNQQVQFGLANADGEIAHLMLLSGRPDDARLEALSSVQRATALMRAEPTNAVWLQELCFSRMTLAEALLALARTREALKEAEAVAQGLRTLLATDGSHPAWHTELQGRLLAMQAAASPNDKAIHEQMARYLLWVATMDGERMSSTLRLQIGRVASALARFETRGSPSTASFANRRVVKVGTMGQHTTRNPHATPRCKRQSCKDRHHGQ